MERLEFNIDINASKQKVWNVLWNDTTYPQWTAVFTEGSRAESDWKEGSKVLFLDGKGDGLVSKIETLDENNTMVFKHLGEMSKGVEKPSDAKSMEWEGATESYFLKEADGVTSLEVELFGTEEHKTYFESMFPKALDVVKQLAEQS
ncbi:SRPBCC domain-containing protein [Runella sp.]|uniref:SRPBCC domain-containing protein n=1 Tax=Runella sp. TaxID=1960881 RepID=UPI003D10FC35